MTWFFGYGSLMWRPGFAVAEARPAMLEGHHRAFCRYSFRHRGTPPQPGLVMGLMPGGNCLGMALRTPDDQAGQVLEYLDEREGAGYRRARLPLQLKRPDGLVEDEPPVMAWVYLPDPDHDSYFGSLPRPRLVELLATGNGESGSSLDYLRQLLRNMQQLGLAEPGWRELLSDAEAWPGRQAYSARNGGRPAP